MNLQIKQMLKRFSRLGLEINYAFDNGISILGLNVSRARHPFAERSLPGLKECLKLNPRSVLDVGSGGGHHAWAFSEEGASVTCVDFGTSIYAKAAVSKNGLTVINTDFTTWETEITYDLVWASHVLEHQRNVGVFIDKLISMCSVTGNIAITVPFPHRRLWGGHLTLWTPGLLAYNIVLCGIDLSDATMLYGYRETTIIFKPKRVILPELTFDSGDIKLLAKFLPANFSEGTDPWF